MADQITTPPEWKAWEEGTGRCPYCVDECPCGWWAMCDCFMAPKPDEYPCAESGCWSLADAASDTETRLLVWQHQERRR